MSARGSGGKTTAARQVRVWPQVERRQRCGLRALGSSGPRATRSDAVTQMRVPSRTAGSDIPRPVRSNSLHRAACSAGRPGRPELPGALPGAPPPPPPAPPSLGHMIATDRALQPPACSALAAGRGGGAASAVRGRHHRNLNISPMVPRGLPLIGWAGGRCVIQSRWRSARRRRRLEADGCSEPQAPRSEGGQRFASLPPAGFAPRLRHGFPQLPGQRWR